MVHFKRALRAIETLEQLLPTMAPDDRQDILDRLTKAARPTDLPPLTPERQEERNEFVHELFCKSCEARGIDFDPAGDLWHCRPTRHELWMFCDGVNADPKTAMSIECFPCNVLYFFFLVDDFLQRHPLPVDMEAAVGDWVEATLDGREPERGELTQIFKAIACNKLGRSEAAATAVERAYQRYRAKKADK